jgi:hypothetical protein
MIPNVVINIIAGYAAKDPTIMDILEPSTIEWAKVDCSCLGKNDYSQQLDLTPIEWGKVDWSALIPKAYKENVKDITKELHELLK